MVQFFLRESLSEERAKKSDMEIIDKLFGIWKGREIESQSHRKKVWKN